jgi:hypothetical protein
MKIFAITLLCALACAACAKPLTTLSDGKPGYAVYCDTLRTRCLDEIALLCRDKSPMLISERAQEVSLPADWIDTGGLAKFNSRYWMEVRCDP